MKVTNIVKTFRDSCFHMLSFWRKDRKIIILLFTYVYFWTHFWNNENPFRESEVIELWMEINKTIWSAHTHNQSVISIFGADSTKSRITCHCKFCRSIHYFSSRLIKHANLSKTKMWFYKLNLIYRIGPWNAFSPIAVN